MRAALASPLGSEIRSLRAKALCQQPPTTAYCGHVNDQEIFADNQEGGKVRKVRVDQILHGYALAAPLEPRGRKYCVPRIGSLPRLSSSCRSVRRSTMSRSLVLTTRRFDEV